MTQQYADHEHLWQQCLKIIRDIIGPELCDAWFSHTKSVSFNDNKVTLCVPNQFIVEVYEQHYYNVLSSAMRRVYGENVSLSYQVRLVQDDDSSKITLRSVPQSRILKNPVEAKLKSSSTNLNGVAYEDVETNLNPSYNFANYCVGESNKLPYTIAEHIANHPDHTEFNPFFLYGSVGVGKTHLIQAIGIRIKELIPRARVLYVTLRVFQNQQSIAHMQKKIPDFINFYQSIDVLLIDDLQEIAGKTGTMDALFPIFHHLHQHGKKLIFTCDRPPKDLDGVTDRLIDRFKWGITEVLPKPDYDLRKKILLHKAAIYGLDIPMNVIDLIAANVTGSVRELEGVVGGILSHSISDNQPITEALAKRVMEHSIKTKKHTINFDMIVETTAEFYSINPDVIFSKSRVNDIANARQVIMYLAKKYTDLSTPAIGQKLNRTHPTVLHGIKTITDRIPIEKSLSNAVNSIETMLTK